MGHYDDALSHIELTSPTAGKADLYLFQREGLGWAAHLITHQGNRSNLPIVEVGNYRHQALAKLVLRNECAPWAAFLRGYELQTMRTSKAAGLHPTNGTPPQPPEGPDLLA